MTEDEARKLATRIIDTWPNGARAYIWRDVLIPLDHHCADVTYRLLRDSATTVPPTGKFRDEYKRQLIRLSQQPEQLFAADTENVVSVADYLERHPDEQHWTPTRERLAARHRHPSTKDHTS